jgi:hypothetical protein
VRHGHWDFQAHKHFSDTYPGSGLGSAGSMPIIENRVTVAPHLLAVIGCNVLYVFNAIKNHSNISQIAMERQLIIRNTR